MRRIRLLALAIGLVSIFGACASEDPALEEPEATTEAVDEATDGAAGGTTEASDVAVVDHEEYGEILGTQGAKTLYVFLNDTEGTSNCNDACAETWPPLEPTGDSPVLGDGVDASLVDTIERADGTTQVTYNGRPLYTYAADGENETKGQGVGGNWYVVSAEGEPVQE